MFSFELTKILIDRSAKKRRESVGFSCTSLCHVASPTRSTPNNRPTWPRDNWKSPSNSSSHCSNASRYESPTTSPPIFWQLMFEYNHRCFVLRSTSKCPRPRRLWRRVSWKERRPYWLTKLFTTPFRVTRNFFYAPIESCTPLRPVASHRRTFEMFSDWVSSVEFVRCPTSTVSPKKRFWRRGWWNSTLFLKVFS